MKETLETYNLCLEACKAMKERMEEEAASEGKTDALDFASKIGASSASSFASVKNNLFFLGNRNGINYLHSGGEILSRLYQTSNLVYELKEALECIEYIERLKSEINSDGDMDSRFKAWKKKIVDECFVITKEKHQKEWNYVQPPYSKEPWPIAIPTLAGVVGGFIFGTVLHEYLNNSFSHLLPVGLPILLGGGALLIIGLVNGKEKNDYRKRVANCERINEKNHKEYFDKMFSSMGFAMEDYMIANLDNIEFVMSNLATSSYRLLCSSAFDFLPSKYKFDWDVLWKFIGYFQDMRVSTIQEAVNLYISECKEKEYRSRMADLEKQILAYQSEMRQKEVERNALISQLSEAVGELRRSNEKAEEQRQRDASELKSKLDDAKDREEKLKSDLADAKSSLNELKKYLD